MEGRELLSKLSDSFGISGNEHNLHNILSEYFKKYTDEIKIGKLGDFTAIKRGTSNGKYKIMVQAHADEIGLIVKDIDERGFVHFTRVAGVDPKTLPAQEVIIHGKREVYGVIGAKPPHVLSAEDMKKAISMDDMVIDAGMTKEEISELVTVGDFITIKINCTKLLGDYITGKALDDRAGICSLFECAKYLQKMRHSADVYFVSSTNEETGFGGVIPPTYEINPDIAIAIDVTFGDKYASDNITSECGKGIEITVGPNIHPELSDRLRAIADENNIPYFLDVAPGHTGTDAWNIQTVREGIPTLLVSIPVKYMHTSTEVLNYKDVEKAGKLLAHFISWFEDWRDVYDA
ncbi:M20/M25/M40 family metallo-hydrolase [Fonticella tunisiensis]|uniref:Endoglucanase n=1 Tax=Fonticella tunisiensis TaxID=1096341 RepID=A0A4R7KQH1_9CLOT|nr:M20/M25/M40 family metallo-hydrolase [Fonticella tunisiensis]TDT60934.1 endoglucanase [Fonticella tunisiensis]